MSAILRMTCANCGNAISRRTPAYAWTHTSGGGGNICYPWRISHQGWAGPATGSEPEAHAALDRQEAEYFGDYGHLVYYSEVPGAGGWRPLRHATRDELRRSMMLFAKAADYVAANHAYPFDRSLYDSDYIAYERAVRTGCWPDEEGRTVTVDRPLKTYAEHDPGYDGELRDLWPAFWAEITSTGRLVQRGAAYYLPAVMEAQEPVGLAEIAGRLGVTRKTADQWRPRGLLPKPEPTTVGGRPWWRWGTIRDWAQATGRAAGDAGSASAEAAP